MSQTLEHAEFAFESERIIKARSYELSLQGINKSQPFPLEK